MKFLCWFGFHTWSLWSRERYNPFNFLMEQKCVCMHCNKMKTKYK